MPWHFTRQEAGLLSGTAKELSQKLNLKKTKQQQKKPQSIYLLVLPKLKISSPTAKEKQTNKQNLRPLPPSSLKVTEHRMNCSGTGGCREPGGGDGKINSPNT